MSDAPVIPEDVIERAARALFDYEAQTTDKLVRHGVIEPVLWDDLPLGCPAHDYAGARAWAALAASGLPARVAELEELCDQLAFIVNSYDEASSDVYKAELRAEVIEAARLLAAALNAKGAE